VLVLKSAIIADLSPVNEFNASSSTAGNWYCSFLIEKYYFLFSILELLFSKYFWKDERKICGCII